MLVLSLTRGKVYDSESNELIDGLTYGQVSQVLTNMVRAGSRFVDAKSTDHDTKMSIIAMDLWASGETCLVQVS